MKLFQQRKASKWMLGLALVGLSCAVNAQEEQKVQGFVHEQSDESGYVWPTDSLVLKKLDVWKDQKFGVLFHWGLYSVPGIVESWSICSEDVDWIPRDTTWAYEDYKKWYWGLKDSFNPVDFNPDQWADVMEEPANPVNLSSKSTSSHRLMLSMPALRRSKLFIFSVG